MKTVKRYTKKKKIKVKKAVAMATGPAYEDLYTRLEMSQILLGNPRGPVKQGNPNTFAEVKLCLLFIYSGSRSSFL